jgi:hypothetical protein
MPNVALSNPMSSVCLKPLLGASPLLSRTGSDCPVDGLLDEEEPPDDVDPNSEEKLSDEVKVPEDDEELPEDELPDDEDPIDMSLANRIKD